MNYIHSIALTRLRNAEYIEFMRSGLDIVNTQTAVKTAVVNEYNAAMTALGLLNNAFINDPQSPITAELTELDERRDKMVTGLVVLTNGYTYSPIAAEAAAADKLSRNLEIYGKAIAKQGYNAETTSIDNILNDWSSKTELADAVATLNLGAWVAALTTVNTEFRTKYAQRTQTIAIQSGETPKSVRELRPQTDAALLALLKKLDGYHAIHDGQAPWGIVTSQINILIDDANQQLAARATRAAKTAEAEPA